MENWTRLDVTGSRLPRYLPDERKVREAPFTAIFDGSEKPPDLSSGTAYVTNLRVLWVSDSNPPDHPHHALALDLAKVISFDKGSNRITKITSSPRIRINLPGVQKREMSSRNTELQQLLLGAVTPDQNLETPPARKWTCSICDYEDNTSQNPSLCDLCGVPRMDEDPAPTPPPNPSRQPSVLYTSAPLGLDDEDHDDRPDTFQRACPACTFLNLPAADRCEICETVLPPLVRPPRSRSPQPVRRAGGAASDYGNHGSGPTYPLTSPSPVSPSFPSLDTYGVSSSLSNPNLSPSSLTLSSKPLPPVPRVPTSFVQLAFRAPPASKDVLRISEQRVRDEFLAALAAAVRGRAWEVADRADQARREAEERKKKEDEERLQRERIELEGAVGIRYFQRTQEHRQAALARDLTGAFSGDLETLMAQARAVVEKAQLVTNRLLEAGASQGGKEGEVFRGYLAELGIVSIESPVTKETAGSSFHMQLAREISDILASLLTPSRRPNAPTSRSTPMIPLPDLYCLVTRARSNALVSPTDLLRACQQMDSLALPWALRTFKSGLICLADRSLDDAEVANRVAEACTEMAQESLKRGKAGSISGAVGPYGVGATVVDLAEACGVSVLLAGEWAGVAEGRGTIVRDEAWDGTRYFANELGDGLWGKGWGVLSDGRREVM